MISCQTQESISKINGITLEAPAQEINYQIFANMMAISPNSVALIPYAYGGNISSPILQYNNSHQWWGETEIGTQKCAEYADSLHLDILVKPQIWFSQGKYTGDIQCNTQKEWEEWEKKYTKYIMSYAHLCEKLHVNYFCIGTELKNHTLKRPKYWKKLIQQVRKVYHGKITYAANWDEYKYVTFWKELDFIGINAYFPIVSNLKYTTEELNEGWEVYLEEMKNISGQYDRKVIFTEYGYRSISSSAYKPWESYVGRDYSEKSQQESLEVFFEKVWNQSWVKGGYLWKWKTGITSKNQNTSYSIQYKSAEKLINNNYQK